MSINRKHLHSRSVISVTGSETSSFLQNIFTNDIRLIKEGLLQYNLLLTAQGQVLHDVFIYQVAGSFYIDVESSRKEDLVRRLTMFKLRAKVDITTTDLHVYASDTEGMDDPRYSLLGRRFYTSEILPDADNESVYDDLCLMHAIPNGSKTILYGKDYAHEINLDFLHAISFEKGCFIGQELTARVHHRGLAKKRLMRMDADGFSLCDDIRQSSADGQYAVGIVKLALLPNNNVQIPKYVKL